MARETYSPRRNLGPFDDAAQERLRRMGLLTAEGMPDQDALAVAARLYAGLLFNNLCDFYSDIESVNAICRDLVERSQTEDPRHSFLAICSAYDAMYVALPEPVWWIAGNIKLVSQFAAGFARRVAEILEEAG